MLKKLAKRFEEVEWIDDKCFHVGELDVFIGIENGKLFVSKSFPLSNFMKAFEEIFGVELNKATPKIVQLYELALRRMEEYIRNKLATKLEIEISFDVLDVAKYCKNTKEVLEWAKKLSEIELDIYNGWRSVYSWLTVSEIRNGIVSKIKYVAPIEIKPLGGSYVVRIPKDALNLLLDEAVLKQKRVIKARLTVFPEKSEILIDEIEPS